MNQTESQTGMNRTGIQMSPFDSRAMQHYEGDPPEVFFDDSGIADVRSDYIANAEVLGSVPLPLPGKGAVQAGSATGATGGARDLPDEVSDNLLNNLLDKLGERLAFERTGTRLYDALITKCTATLDGTLSMTIPELQEIRDDEARHFLAVAQAIETLGGDATSQTPSADLVGIESAGLVQVVSDPRTTIAQSLHAILTAELSDHAGWQALIALAEEYDDQADMVSDFTLALEEEHGHLMMVQGWYEEAIGLPPSAPYDDDDDDDYQEELSWTR